MLWKKKMIDVLSCFYSISWRLKNVAPILSLVLRAKIKVFLLPGEHCSGGYSAASLAKDCLIVRWVLFFCLFVLGLVLKNNIGSTEIVEGDCKYLQDTILVIKAGFFWLQRGGLNSWDSHDVELRHPVELTSRLELSILHSFMKKKKKKVKKILTVFMRAGEAVKQPQKLLLARLHLWLCFGMTVDLWPVFCDELSCFRKWEAHSQHVPWISLLWDLRQKTCPDKSWLWLT